MSGSNASGVKSFVGLIVAVLVGVPLLIFMIVKLFTSGSGVDLGSSSMTSQAIDARLQPVGISTVVDSTPIGQRSGKMVYEGVCIACHGTGLAGSPKFGDATAWAPRIAKGFETLWTHAIQGFNNAMPARGGAADLTDDEVKRAVAYMADQAGAKFVAPEAQAAAGSASGAASAATVGTAPAAAATTAAVDPAVKGKEVYESTCQACHATGLAGSPKFGDKAAWTAKLAGNPDAAIEKVLKSGNGAMPPKGGYTGTDDEFRAAAHYMISNAK